jgi:hypothetical protein
VPGEPYELHADESLLTDESERYFRQCHPSFLKNGQPSSQFLADFPRDEGMLSGARSRAVNATESFLDFVAAGLKTGGTWALTVEEVVAVKSRLVDDTKCPPTKPPRLRGHTYLDFRNFEPDERRAAVSALLIAFKQRGQLAVLD